MLRGKRASTTLLKPRTKRRQTVAELEESQERKQAEEALQAERNKLQSLIGAIEYTLTIQDRDYNIIYQNELSRIASGGDHLGEKCYRAYEHRDKVCHGCPVEKAFKDGKSHTAERQTVLPSGEVAFWENTASPIRGARGEIISCLELARDITERKKADEALRESEEKYKTLVEDVPIGIYFNDFGGTFLYGNKKAEEITGYKREELLGKSFLKLKLLDPQELVKAIKLLALNRLGKSTGPDRFVLNRKDGTKGIVEIHTRITTVGGKKVVLGMVEDITERKKQEQALANEVTRRRILVDQSLDGIVVLDVEARVVEANQRFAEMLGYSPEEVRKLHTWDWDKNFPPEKLLEMGRAVDEQGLHLETQHHRKDGSVIDVDISINGTVIAGQKLIFCVCRDITERRQAGEALRKSEEKFSKAFRASPSTVTITTLKDGKFLELNDTFTRLTGYSREELIGRNSTDINFWVDPEDRNRILQIIKEQGRVNNVEANIRRKSGEIRTWLFSMEPIDIGGELCLLSATTDITERKRAEEALKAAQERLVRSEKLAAIGQLAGGVGHELRNPLSAIKTAAQYARKKLAASELSASEPKVLEFLGLIDEEVDRANKVITDLLSFSRVAKPTVSSVKVEGIIRDALSHVAVPGNVTVVTDVSPDLPMVMIDAGQIQQVFVNIILNALEAMPEGGRLEVRASSKDGFVMVEFTDTGSGIPEAVAGKIFEPLFTTKAKGIGLGLAMSKNIMERHGGDIGVQSKEGDGTTFTISLPTRAV
jgi:PAS domain S-box-containing protein